MLGEGVRARVRRNSPPGSRPRTRLSSRAYGRGGALGAPLQPAGAGPFASIAVASAAPAPTISAASERDLALVAGVLSGSQAHFDELYESYFPRVYRFALKRLGDPAEAEDVTQEVFETVFRALPSYRGDSSLLVWIFGITRNKVNRRFRGVRPRLESLDESGAESLAGQMAPTDRTVEARRMLDRCDAVVSKQLTPLQRRIFHLKHLRSQPIRAIAQALGKSEDAIKANLYRMRRALAEGAPGLEAFLGF
jgi:RNA polymerase sigma-70 factor (ECF subfamily)